MESETLAQNNQEKLKILQVESKATEKKERRTWDKQEGDSMRN